MRINWRIALLWASAIGGVLAALATWYLGYAVAHPNYVKKPNDDYRGWALALLAIIAVVSALSRPVQRLFGGPSPERRSLVRRAMDILTFQVYETTSHSVPLDQMGASAFVVRGLVFKRLDRIARSRISDEPGTSGIRWTKGKGVVGRCWEKGVPLAVEVERIHNRHSGCTEVAWLSVGDETRMKLDWNEFNRITGKYGTVVAVPIRDRAERVIGVIALDCAPGHGHHAHLEAQRVKADVTRAAGTVAGLLGRA